MTTRHVIVYGFLLGMLAGSGAARADDVRVRDAAGLRAAVAAAKPGTRILLAPGVYAGPFYFSIVRGAPGREVVIQAADPKTPPVLTGGAECLHLSDVSHLTLQDLTLRGARVNGLNIDDGGTYETPSHHVTLRRLRVQDIGSGGNQDGIKLSGLDDFRVEDCTVERWSGSGIDMVGCHRGRITGCVFRRGGSEGVQGKGGTSEIVIERCRFEEYGGRGVNIGGSTGMAFFRPPVAKMPPDGRYEARDIRVEGCVFVGGEAPVAFVGVDGATVRRNTLYRPGRWALRILQETREPGFVPSRRGAFEENLVVFRSDGWAGGGVNIGPGTAPETFRFARNAWYCEDRSDRSRPTLPAPETGGLYGRDPLLRDPARGDFSLQPGSPAAGRGAQPTPAGAPAARDGETWKEAMRRVHARFTGRPGTFAQFGDSITVTMAYWAPLFESRRNASPEVERAFAVTIARLAPECRREWKGPEYGSEGGRTVGWAAENVQAWLKRLNPEVALLMFGTNDLPELGAEEYAAQLRRIVRACMDNGTVVLLSTIPPRHGFEQKAVLFAEAARQVAREMAAPLVDYHAAILERRPDDWDGALEKFAAHNDYDVPTLISRDGVHPSYPVRWQGDWSEEALSRSGYQLRSVLTLLAYAEVIRALDAPAPAPTPRPQEAALPQPPSRPWFPKAPPLPAPTGVILRVADAGALYEAVEKVPPGGTILLADGLYRLPRPVEIRRDRVTLRGQSGRREAVVLDGGSQGELIRITACSGVTLADLTVQNVKWNGVKINSETNVQRVTLYNCVLHNIWQRAVKGVKVPETDRERVRPKDCRIAYCLFYNDRPKRFEDDEADTPQSFNGNYVGGIDVMYPRGWVIHDNVFIGIKGRTGEARGAVFLWHEAQDCVVERNIVMDCDSGICLGNSHRPEDVPIHATGCIVRNNVLARVSENGLLADYTRDCRILHNTVFDPDSPQGRLIRLVHDNDGLRVENNLLAGLPVRNESASRILLRGNVERAAADWFMAPADGDLRLTARATGAIDQCAPVGVMEDIERRARDSRPDAGAHEYRR